jgi:hypothetical protein
MQNKKTKVTFPARILTLFIVAFLTFWLIPSNLVFAYGGDKTPPVTALNDASFVYAVAGSIYEDSGTDGTGEAVSADSIPVPGGVIKDLTFTGIDPIMPISGAAAAITVFILILVSLRKRQYRKWKNSLGYSTKDEA